MGNCKCGCGNPAGAGDFLPGHDQKLRTGLENQVGGLLALHELVQGTKRYSDGEMGAEEFENHIRRIFASRNRDKD